MKIVIRGGPIDAASLAKNPQEYTTQDVLTSLSVYVGSVKKLGPDSADEIWAIAAGYPGQMISAVDQKWFDDHGAVITPDPLLGQPNHALLSGITIDKAVELFASYRGMALRNDYRATE